MAPTLNLNMPNEAKYGWFMRDVAGIVEVLGSVEANYALYKFRRSF
jgi:hypothetical protein